MIVTENHRMLAQTTTPDRDGEAVLRVLVETVNRLAERIELLEARVALDAARRAAIA